MAYYEEASPICRGKNLSWETVLLFYNNMPRTALPKPTFHSYVESRINGWTQTHSQIARQLAFYYEQDGMCYPRFTEETTYSDLFLYMQNWASKYFVPNPYAPSLKAYDPVCLYLFLKNSIEQGNTDFDAALDSIFEVKLSSHDKVNVFLSNFTNIVIDGNHQMRINDRINFPEVKQDVLNDYVSDAKKYFDYFTIQSKTGNSSYLRKPNLNYFSYLSFLTAIRTKPFLLLAGISGTGKSRIVRKLAQATDDIDVFENEEDRWECHKPTNFELIQVKPNWHNSMDVVGYKSNIGGEHYEFTPFVEFVAKAWLHPDTPFFLCLDEMNLAPVEEYFAEYLSAIESRTFEKGEYETDPIIKPFKDFGEGLSAKMITHLLGNNSDNDIAKRFREKGLTLPKNLIVMGTVNMDDTTFSFSRKVLDRAMSIEMNEVDYSAFLDGTSEDDVPVLVEDNALLIDRPIKGQTVKNEIEAENVIQYLTDVNEVLDGTPFKLGYRAANEAVLYVAAAKAWGNDSLTDALDQFTLMKILSRIEGDESKLMKDADRTVLECLSEVINKHLGTNVSDVETSTEEAESVAKLKSIKKLEEMTAVLDRDHFVSYWS